MFSIRHREVARLRDIHCNDVIMSAMASQITSLAIVYSTVYNNGLSDQGKYQNSALMAFVRGIHRSPVNSPHKGQWRGNCFHLMTSSYRLTCCQSVWNLIAPNAAQPPFNGDFSHSATETGEYLKASRSTSRMLIPRHLASPVHRQPWYWLCNIDGSCLSRRKFATTCPFYEHGLSLIQYG